MIKEKLKKIIEDAIQKAISSGKLGGLTAGVPVVIDKPRLPEHGDLASGVAMKLAGPARMAPIKIAETIAAIIKENLEIDPEAISSFEVAPPGFINFHLGTKWLSEALLEIHKQGQDFGKLKMGAGQKVLVEYVSANPTGELHVGHGRNAVYGSCLSNLLKFAGYEVKQEFYINDAGEQISQLGLCVWALYQRKLGKAVEYPAEGYPEYLLSAYTDQIIKTHGDQYLSLNDEEAKVKFADLSMAVIKEDQKKLLEELRIVFDSWFSERTLHEKGEVNIALKRFAELGMCYEEEGALWLKAKELGDERDRVLKKSSGNTTYLANDAAYHLDKFERGYDWLINIWGADHHGQVPGLKAAVQALGKDPDKLEIVLTQIVNLSRDGQLVRMSKRKGTVVMLSEVMEEVGVDATRYYLAESNPQNPISFDLELAKKQGRENPAFYIQYAHARCSSILRTAIEPRINSDTGKQDPPHLDPAQFSDLTKSFKETSDVFKPLFDSEKAKFAIQKELIMHLDSLPEEVEEAVMTRTPGRLARFAYELANDLQRFYENSRVLTDDIDVTRARLGLIIAMKQVLSNILGIIGVSAPDKM